MAHPASMQRRETRRHRLIGCCLVTAALGSSLLVTNERALFIPVKAPGLSATAAAFAAMFAPFYPLRHLAADAMPTIEPFDVFADSHDMRRRLMEAFGDFAEPTDAGEGGTTQFGSQALSPVELASSAVPGAETVAPAASDESSVPSPASPAAGPSRGIGPLSPTTTPGFSPTDLAIAESVPPAQSSTAVPEPSCWMLLLAGFGAIGFILRAKRHRDAEEGIGTGG